MKKGGVLLSLVTVTMILFTTFLSIEASAGEAGVGVLNVPPKYSMIRVVQQDKFIRVYLTISDYNSWDDIYTVNVTLEDYGLEIAEFLFKQYEDTISYEKINEFSETSKENNLLVKEKCSYNHSDEKETVADKCNLELLFVFHKTWFTRLNIIIADLDGSTASTHIDYNAEETMRSGNIIMIPWLHEPIRVVIPSYLLNLLAVIAGLIGVIFCVRKMDRIKIKRVAYEKG